MNEKGMNRYNRVVLIILDSLGVGALPDAADYGDVNTNTLSNMAKKAGGIKIPTMEQFGIGNITDITGVEKVDSPVAYYTKAREASAGKDTLTGHWEIMGIKIDKALATFTKTGFPQKLIKILEQETGRKFVGNITASGTQIIDELGEHHLKTGDLILYTSADSVMQIAAHESIVEITELYKICKIAREITTCNEWKVGRVIARPFIGEVGHFIRTHNRRDYALRPPKKTVLNSLKDSGYDVIGIGKINDIYAGEGITKSYSSKSNDHGIELLIRVIQSQFKGLAYLNLVDFDMKYGHRRDYMGYVEALEVFDNQLKALIQELNINDLLILTADHGNDPTHIGSDHTREHVPVLMYSKCLKEMKALDTFSTFANIGATIADNFNVEKLELGESVLDLLI